MNSFYSAFLLFTFVATLALAAAAAGPESVLVVQTDGSLRPAVNTNKMWAHYAYAAIVRFPTEPTARNVLPALVAGAQTSHAAGGILSDEEALGIVRSTLGVGVANTEVRAVVGLISIDDDVGRRSLELALDPRAPLLQWLGPVCDPEGCYLVSVQSRVMRDDLSAAWLELEEAVKAAGKHRSLGAFLLALDEQDDVVEYVRRSSEAMGVWQSEGQRERALDAITADLYLLMKRPMTSGEL